MNQQAQMNKAFQTAKNQFVTSGFTDYKNITGWKAQSPLDGDGGGAGYGDDWGNGETTGYGKKTITPQQWPPMVKYLPFPYGDGLGNSTASPITTPVTTPTTITWW